MASRKRKDAGQLGLGLPSLPSSPDLLVSASVATVPAQVTADLGQYFNVEDLDDYDDAAFVEDVPRLRLLDPPREVSVIVEAVGESFEVSRLREGGTTVATVTWTRKEIEELAMRIRAALEVG